MTSKEALEYLYNMACVEAGQKQQFITYAREIEHNENVKKHYDIIKQDLERKEQLEKENQELKEKAQKYDELCKHNVMESQSFGDDLIQGILALNKRIIESNKKLKKAINILKDNLWLVENGNYRLSVNGSHDYQELSQQEYELLKELFTIWGWI